MEIWHKSFSIFIIIANFEKSFFLCVLLLLIIKDRPIYWISIYCYSHYPSNSVISWPMLFYLHSKKYCFQTVYLSLKQAVLLFWIKNDNTSLNIFFFSINWVSALGSRQLRLISTGRKPERTVAMKETESELTLLIAYQINNPPLTTLLRCWESV